MEICIAIGLKIVSDSNCSIRKIQRKYSPYGDRASVCLPVIFFDNSCTDLNFSFCKVFVTPWTQGLLILVRVRSTVLEIYCLNWSLTLL
jgi:hypothetical protein